jgi:hypothetical protein
MSGLHRSFFDKDEGYKGMEKEELTYLLLYEEVSGNDWINSYDGKRTSSRYYGKRYMRLAWSQVCESAD